MKKLFIITGEYSGDIHASNVVQELKKLNPDIEIEGVGGENLENCGVRLFSTHKKMSAVGISTKILVEHLNLGRKIVNYLKDEYKPDLVLLIDYGAFNLNIAKILKREGIKIDYYIPPQVWASRKWRINVIKKNINKVFCIFPFEKAMYERFGINTSYVGHPLVNQLPEKANKADFFNRHGFDINKKLVSIFPGSRVFELKSLMKIFIKSAKILQELHPELQFCISQAPNLSDNVYNKYLKDTDFKVIKGENQALLSVSDALILASGTVSLEAALYGTPMLISYRGPWLLYLIYLLVRCINKVSLPNIILNKNVVPEIIQGRAKSDFIAYHAEKLIYDDEVRNSQINSLKEVRNLLSDKYSAKEVAVELYEDLK